MTEWKVESILGLPENSSIEDDRLIVLVVLLGHRREIYER